jgi:hypothetical protein
MLARSALQPPVLQRKEEAGDLRSGSGSAFDPCEDARDNSI